MIVRSLSTDALTINTNTYFEKQSGAIDLNYVGFAILVLHWTSQLTDLSLMSVESPFFIRYLAVNVELVTFKSTRYERYGMTAILGFNFSTEQSHNRIQH